MSGSVPPVFQLYRLPYPPGVWWRMVSPNGRVLGVSARAFGTPERARDHIDRVIAERGDLQPSVRFTGTHRWQWALTLDSVPEVRGHTEQDRRARCEAAWRLFVEAAPGATITEAVHGFSGGAQAAGRISAGRQGAGAMKRPS